MILNYWIRYWSNTTEASFIIIFCSTEDYKPDIILDYSEKVWCKTWTYLKLKLLLGFLLLLDLLKQTEETLIA